MTTSVLVNRFLKKDLYPLLSSKGFHENIGRNYYAWYEECIWVLNIRSVGYYFSQSTHWPPQSLTVFLGVYYTFFPKPSNPRTYSENNGRLYPQEFVCQSRTCLTVENDQSIYQSTLPSKPERERRDIWWVGINGENAEASVKDICNQFELHGYQWFQKYSDLCCVLAEWEAERDCYAKYHKLSFLTKHMNMNEKFQFNFNKLTEYSKKTDLPLPVIDQ